MKFLTVSLVSLFLLSCGTTGDLTKPEEKQEVKKEVETMKLSTNDNVHKKYDLERDNVVKQETDKQKTTTVVKPMIDDTVKQYKEHKAPQFDTGIRPTNSK